MPKVTTRGAGAGRSAPDAAQEPHARLYWKDGRAYIDARAWASWGGKLEALVVPGERGATKDAVQGAILFARRLAQLRAFRAEHPDGLPRPAEESEPAVEELDRIATFAGWYLAEKEARPGASASPGATWRTSDRSSLTLPGSSRRSAARSFCGSWRRRTSAST